jgi:hypothetical protein
VCSTAWRWRFGPCWFAIPNNTKLLLLCTGCSKGHCQGVCQGIQGCGGGTLRQLPLASAATTKSASSSCCGDETQCYYRAVDQAVAVLACLEHIQTLDKLLQEDESSIRNNTELEGERRLFERLVTVTCQFLLARDAFGYGNFSAAMTYIGIERNRNFWHDGWVVLALISARKYLWPMDSNGLELLLQTLRRGLSYKYGHYSSSSPGSTADLSSSFDGTV